MNKTSSGGGFLQPRAVNRKPCVPIIPDNGPFHSGFRTYPHQAQKEKDEVPERIPTGLSFPL